MTPKEYLKNAAVTDHRIDGYDLVGERCDALAPMIHYALGMCTETAEIQDILKKAIAYGKPLDLVHVKEELGDLMWYVARMCSTCGFTLEDVMQTNINKLQARYGEKFSEAAALNRNLDNERRVLED